jgi:hypothetical protein
MSKKAKAAGVANSASLQAVPVPPYDATDVKLEDTMPPPYDAIDVELRKLGAREGKLAAQLNAVRVKMAEAALGKYQGDWDEAVLKKAQEVRDARRSLNRLRRQLKVAVQQRNLLVYDFAEKFSAGPWNPNDARAFMLAQIEGHRGAKEERLIREEIRLAKKFGPKELEQEPLLWHEMLAVMQGDLVDELR